MSDTDIIRTDRPHEVSIPEGSHMAVAKTATQQEASIRKNYRQEGGQDDAHIVPDKYLRDSSSQPSGEPRTLAHDDATQRTAAESARPSQGGSAVSVDPERMADRLGAASESGPAEMASAQLVPSLRAPPRQHDGHDSRDDPKDSARASESKEELGSFQASAQEEMPEMDFPARVVHLHIENEKLRKQLDELEADV